MKVLLSRLVAYGLTATLTVPAHSQSTSPTCLINNGNTLYRVNAAGLGSIDPFPNVDGVIHGMTLVPDGLSVLGCSPGDIIAVENVAGGRMWRVDGAKYGPITLVPIGRVPSNFPCTSLAFAHQRLFSISGAAQFRELDLNTFEQIGQTVDLRGGQTAVGGLAFDGNSTWYVTNAGVNRLITLSDPPTPDSWHAVGDSGTQFGAHGIEYFGNQVWIGLQDNQSRIRIGTLSTTTGAYTNVWDVVNTPPNGERGFVAFAPECLDIYTQPSSASTCLLGQVVLSLSAAGTSALRYQWQILDGSIPTGWNDIIDGAIFIAGQQIAAVAGANDSSLSITSFVSPGSWQFRCVVSSDCGQTRSNPVSVIVCDADADLDCDGDVDLPDLAVLLSNFGRTDSPSLADGNIDSDEDVDVQDLAYVLADFGIPCP